MKDAEFLEQFEQLQIAGSDFHHRDHVRLAWICLQREGWPGGAARFAASFARFVTHVGAQSKYHETISWFYLAVIHERMAREAAADWPAFAADNPDVLDPTMALLRARYSPADLASPWARRVFVLPTRGA